MRVRKCSYCGSEFSVQEFRCPSCGAKKYTEIAKTPAVNNQPVQQPVRHPVMNSRPANQNNSVAMRQRKTVLTVIVIFVSIFVFFSIFGSIIGSILDYDNDWESDRWQDNSVVTERVGNTVSTYWFGFRVEEFEFTDEYTVEYKAGVQFNSTGNKAYRASAGNRLCVVQLVLQTPNFATDMYHKEDFALMSGTRVYNMLDSDINTEYIIPRGRFDFDTVILFEVPNSVLNTLDFVYFGVEEDYNREFKVPLQGGQNSRRAAIGQFHTTSDFEFRVDGLEIVKMYDLAYDTETPGNNTGNRRLHGNSSLDLYVVQLTLRSAGVTTANNRGFRLNAGGTMIGYLDSDIRVDYLLRSGNIEKTTVLVFQVQTSVTTPDLIYTDSGGKIYRVRLTNA